MEIVISYALENHVDAPQRHNDQNLLCKRAVESARRAGDPHAQRRLYSVTHYSERRVALGPSSLETFIAVIGSTQKRRATFTFR
jgi:hypothetical protein